MTVVRLTVMALLFSVVVKAACADPSQPPRMPAKPELGALTADPMPAIPVSTGIGREVGGLGPARLARAMKAALAADDPPTRGKLEQSLFTKFGRSVVLVALPDSLGSGAVIDANGTIVTNWHVVQGYKSVGVIFKPQGGGVVPRIADAAEAKVLYVDEIADLALIKVASLPADIRPLKLGDHTKLAVGADVHAIGHPTGEGWSFTKGVVSQIRSDYEWRYESGPLHRGDVVQSQTPINPGNSGGPLLNDAGEIVGLNTFGNHQATLINYAVAATEIRRFIALRADRRAPDAATNEAMPRTPLPAAQSGSASCTVKKLESRRAVRGDATAHLLDTNCDDVVDAILIVPDSAREPIVLMIDANQNLAPDAVYVDEDRDLKFDFVIYDTDEDGNSDLLGVDLDDDLKPARIVASRA